MRHGFVVVALISALSVPSAFAGAKKKAKDADALDALALIGPIVAALSAGEAPSADAPRLLSEALRSGTADTRTIAAITNWVLNEKEEKVAEGMASALREVHPQATGLEAERWNATVQAILGSFQSVLRDAGAHRRTDGDALVRNLVTVAGPAVAAALAEVEPTVREDITQGIGATAAPAAGTLVPSLVEALGNPEASVRRGAATVLGAMGKDARDAVPQLRRLTDDADPAVRAAAAQALERIEAK